MQTLSQLNQLSFSDIHVGGGVEKEQKSINSQFGAKCTSLSLTHSLKMLSSEEFSSTLIKFSLKNSLRVHKVKFHMYL